MDFFALLTCAESMAIPELTRLVIKSRRVANGIYEVCGCSPRGYLGRYAQRRLEIGLQKMASLLSSLILLLSGFLY